MDGLGHGEEYGYAVPLVYAAPAPAFDELLNRHGKDLHGFVARRVSDPSLVDDIVQETLLRAYRARHVFDRSRPLWPWLATIARNTISNALRGERSRRRHTECEPDWRALEEYADRYVGDDPETRYASKEQRAAIVRALGTLDNRQRRLLLLRAAEDLGYYEIAALEGLSLNSVKSLLKRARRTFRETYEELADESPAGVPLLTRVRVGVRLGYRRLRGRVGWLLETIRYVPGFESAVQIIAAAGVAGALMIGGSSAGAGRSHEGTGSKMTLSYARGAAPVAAPRTKAGRTDTYLFRRSVGAGTAPAALSVAGRIDKHRTDRWTTQVHLHYDVPGTSQGVDEDLDVPCEAGSGLSVCDAAETLPAG